MAIGDTQNIVSRLRSVLPKSWFGDSSPNLNALLTGLATSWSCVYDLYQYIKNQTRISTSTDGFLDMIAGDFLGSRFIRRVGEPDSTYRSRIKINLFRKKGTRGAMHDALTDLTGTEPVIIEPTRPMDVGSYRAGGCGYRRAGAYGSLLIPYQCFIKVTRPPGGGIPGVNGFHGSLGGYNTGSIKYAAISDMITLVTDADIYETIEAVKPVGTIVWTQIN